MPDVKEVFAAATQKIRPEPGFVDRQHDHQRKHQRRSKLGAFAAVVAIATVLALTFAYLAESPPDERSRPGHSGTSTHGNKNQGNDGLMCNRWNGLCRPTHVLTRSAGGVQFSIEVPKEGWENGPHLKNRHTGEFHDGGWLISRSVRGPQGAEAVLFWSAFPSNGYPHACFAAPANSSSADLAAILAAVPGTSLEAGPQDASIGGEPARHLTLTVTRANACTPGFFFEWPDQCWGACWVETKEGDTIELWIVNVSGVHVIFEAETTKEGNRWAPGLREQIGRIVSSVRFETPG